MSCSTGTSATGAAASGVDSGTGTIPGGGMSRGVTSGSAIMPGGRMSRGGCSTVLCVLGVRSQADALNIAIDAPIAGTTTERNTARVLFRSIDRERTASSLCPGERGYENSARRSASTWLPRKRRLTSALGATRSNA